MKLYVIFNQLDNNIIALSEDKKISYMYLLQNKNKNYQLSKIKNEKMIEKISIIYDDLFIEEFEDFYMTTKEYKIIYKKIEEEKERIKLMIEDLLFMINNYNFSLKELKSIKKTINILRKNSKKEKFYLLIMIKDFILNLLGLKNKNIQKLFESIELSDKDYYNIIIK